MEAAVKSDKRLRKKTTKGGDGFYLGRLAERKMLTKREEGRQYFVVNSRAQKNNLDFSLEQLRCFKTKGKVHVCDLLPYHTEFFYPYPQSL